ncbi:MAG: UDP-N-acetylmuramoylalanyl-D-glutamate--2,6-diaminopimelate ligase [Alkaliphilus sp.]|nr:UDP-N-acetylmuramoyl-tripeptide--D-alanyl-D-alanine ligase [bacterium AH-315-E09]PHS36462.1 MAG: UDP-N-acetylmuramoylalanyl-D-glutamate--2,6-diaminopimelate ligase [Alkaliphilus sp.]
MIQLTIESIVNACNGIIIRKGANNYIKGISTDTRRIQPEMLFIPLVGENYDGHDFVIDASKKGIYATLVEKNKKLTFLNELENIYVIEVENTLKALKDISKKYKERFQIPFIAVTGSNGKTSTKDMISAVLSSRYKTLKSEGNFNNQIGLPLTLFNLDKSHEFAVLEMGMSSFGEIEGLVDIVNPNIAVVTNIGMAHIENLGSKENIMKAKMEISKNLSEEDILLFNGDDEYLKSIQHKEHMEHMEHMGTVLLCCSELDCNNTEEPSPCVQQNDTEEPSPCVPRYKAISFGMDKTNDFYPEKIYDLGDKGVAFDILINRETEKFYIKQPGLHNVYNALVAIWVGLFYEITPKEINKSLHSYIPTKMRMEIIENNNCKIINDCYNASPNSMKAALSVLANSVGKRKIAILANMLEMGRFSEKGHRFVGKCVAENKIDILITVGEEAKWIADEAKNAGLDKRNIFKVGKIQETNLLLLEIIKQGDTILVKGSRGMQMENIVQLLLERC